MICFLFTKCHQFVQNPVERVHFEAQIYSKLLTSQASNPHILLSKPVSKFMECHAYKRYDMFCY
jgi:hypothetical protein